MNIQNIISSIVSAVDYVRSAITPIPGILMAYTCARRPGFSSIITSAKVYADMNQTENDEIVKEFVFNLINRIKENIQDDGTCLVVIKPNELQFQLTGGNAGGPVEAIGTNINPVLAWAIIR